MVKHGFENWQNPDQPFARRNHYGSDGMMNDDVDILRSDSRWIPWLVAILISLVLWAVVIGLIFFAIHIYQAENIAPVTVPVADFSDRFQAFSSPSAARTVVILDPALRKCVAGMQAPWGNHGLPY